jgi:hypothetical protein
MFTRALFTKGTRIAKIFCLPEGLVIFVVVV